MNNEPPGPDEQLAPTRLDEQITACLSSAALVFGLQKPRGAYY
jgi:hypothetical protein